MIAVSLGSAGAFDEVEAVSVEVDGVGIVDGLARGKARLVRGPVDRRAARESGGAPRNEASVFAVLVAVEDIAVGDDDTSTDRVCASEGGSKAGVVDAAVNVNGLFVLRTPKPPKPENLGFEEEGYFNVRL